MTAKVVELGPRENMTPDEALSLASREEWDDVMIVGFHKDNGSIVVRSSHMTREFALWIVEHVKLHVLNAA